MRGRRTRQRGSPLRTLVIAGIMLLLLAGAGLVLMSGSEESIEMRDVHGLAVSPEAPGVLLVATHEGLLRGRDGTWTRVGAVEDDFMGFTMHPTNGSVFYVSGHPKGGGSMGVRLSTDGGETWRQTSLRDVDLHALTISPPEPARLWGIAQGRLYATRDAGASWNVTNAQAPNAITLQADPKSPTTLYATTGTGLLRSRDEGLTWQPMGTIPALGLAIDTQDPSIMYVGGENALWVTIDAGATWAPLDAPAQGRFAHLALDPSERQTLYVATTDARIYKSTDAGLTWTTLREA